MDDSGLTLVHRVGQNSYDPGGFGGSDGDSVVYSVLDDGQGGYTVDTYLVQGLTFQQAQWANPVAMRLQQMRMVFLSPRLTIITLHPLLIVLICSISIWIPGKIIRL